MEKRINFGKIVRNGLLTVVLGVATQASAINPREDASSALAQRAARCATGLDASSCVAYGQLNRAILEARCATALDPVACSSLGK